MGTRESWGACVRQPQPLTNACSGLCGKGAKCTCCCLSVSMQSTEEERMGLPRGMRDSDMLHTSWTNSSAMLAMFQSVGAFAMSTTKFLRM
eukprot:33423-Eustigmatos_ZCMA.PRE.1